MSFTDKKGIVVASGFKLQAQALLDVRQQVDTISDRDELVTLNAATPGLRVYVKDKKKSYVYNGTGWDELTTGEAYVHPTGDGNHHVPATGTSNNGKVLMAGSTAGSEYWKKLAKSDISDFPTSLPTPSSIIVKLNGGTTEGTNMFTFNGSAAKTINITPASIGAAASSHGTHVSYGTEDPEANGTASPGTASTVSRSDHVHPLQTTISGNAGSATKLATARTIDGVSFNGSANITHFGTCSTEAATAVKVVSCTGFTLAAGAKITVKFSVTNTASNPTLNVNGTGAKAIMYRGSAITASYLAANRVYTFVYDGTDYELIGDINTDTNTTYGAGTATSLGLTKLYTGTGSNTDGTMTQSAITTALGGKAASSHTHDSGDITDFEDAVDALLPTTLPNPQAITISFNGTSQGAYNGSAAKTINITPSSIGAAAASHGTHVSYGADNPEANGTASPGTASTVSRSDHVHPLQTTVSGNAGSATKLATARTIDGVSFNGTTNITHFGTCSTEAATAAKVVSCTGFTLAAGAKITVKFSATNTAASPTLNVNGTGAKAIMYRGSAISAGNLAAGRVYTFVYDGTNYELIGDINTNTTYSTGTATSLGLTKLYTGTGSNTDGTMTQSAITTALSGKAASSHTHNYAGSSSAGGAANSVKTSLIVKLNGGTTEGTNMFTFNGSAAKTIDITPASIGAAASSHGTHVSYGTEDPEANGTASAGTASTVSRSDHVHPLQTTVSGNAGSATKLATARTIDGVSFNGSANITHFGTCSTAAATAAKVVSCTGFALTAGAKITVKFTVTNTAASPTLNVNSTGAKAIMYRGSAITASYLAAGRVYTFVYDGTNYELIGDININTTYSTGTASALGLTKLYTGTGSNTDGTMTQSAITTALGGKAASSHNHDSGDITDFEDAVTALLPTKLANPYALTFAGAVTGTYDGSSAKTITIPTSGSTDASLIVKLNGGTTEGTNMFTFNGSTAKTINITPSSIGAAASSHGTHVSYSTSNPAANGTASPGTASTVSRSDHVHPLQTTVSGNAGSATKLATARTIDGVSFNGAANIIHFGTCSTEAATVAKVVSCTGFTLATGARITVKFSVTNTAANPTLNVNSTGAKAIMYRGSAITAGYLAANRVYTFVYDGTDYELVGDINTDTNTTYSTGTATSLGLTKLYTGTGSNTDGTMTQSAITSALSGKAASSHTHNYAGSESAGGAANSVKTSLVIKLNGGTTEGTNMFTFNGSAAKSIDITPASIGAAASSHGTHVSYGTSNPAANGTASPGTASTVSRSDHVHPLQTTVSGNAGSATKLATARTIDGVSFNGSANIIHYGTCSTAAATAAKVVTCTGFTLATGAKITVKFTVTNTAASPTLNVNSTGAKSIMYRGAAISAGYLAAGRVYTFIYDGTNYELIGDINTNTTYSTGTASTLGLTKLYTGTGSNTDGTMTQSAITTALSGKAASDHDHSASDITSGTLAVARGGTGVTSNPSMLVNLGSTSAASVFATSPRPGVTGTLPIANGGTGATTAAAARTALGITPANIGAAASSHTHNYAGSSSAGGAATSANKINVPVGTILFSTSSSATFFSSCFGGTWEVVGNVEATINSTTELTLYMFKKTAS